MKKENTKQKARPRKDAVHFNFNFEREVADRLRLEAEAKGQTMTKYLERLLSEHFERLDRKISKK